MCHSQKCVCVCTCVTYMYTCAQSMHTHTQTHTPTHPHTHTYTRTLTYAYKSTYMLITFSIRVLKDAEAHLLLATQKRSYYKSLIDMAKAVLQQTFTVDGQLKLPCLNAQLSPGTHKITMHYSFDMAQQVSMGRN